MRRCLRPEPGAELEDDVLDDADNYDMAVESARVALPSHQAAFPNCRKTGTVRRRLWA